MPDSDGVDLAANCPQCRAAMVHVAIAPHPIVRTMQRSIYMCAPCNRTRTYMLQTPALTGSAADPADPQPQHGHA
jgi:transposase-like protein